VTVTALVGVCVCGKDCVEFVLEADGGATAAAAAAAYLIGVDGGFCGKLAFNMLAIGCWEKLMLGGGFTAKGYVQEVNTTAYKRHEPTHTIQRRLCKGSVDFCAMEMWCSLLSCNVTVDFFNIGLSSRLPLATLSSSCFLV